ncbi:MAG: sigma-54-dependent Fis family transcriptional regulator [Clostridia bacterium]|nr:sigma-54-dependent Fis family transcriptional regulator [Clostridia bacterium]
MTKGSNTLPASDIMDALSIAVRIQSLSGALIHQNPKWDKYSPFVGEVNWNELQEKAVQEGKSRQDVGAWSVRMTVMPAENPIALLVQIVPRGLQEIDIHTKSSVDINTRLERLRLRDCIANSASMIRVFEKAKQVANYPTTVLLVGETGVGKEVVASFIHRSSNRNEHPYIKINCSAIPEQLLESELFGYESGAFTGAKAKGKPGLFELANKGTLLLDEIGDMPMQLQVKLLRVLQENEVRRLGGSHAIPLNVRIISSTNRDLKEKMEQGQFSEALYYRLNVVELNIPPLRERRDDILPLCTYYLRYFCDRYKLEKTFAQEVKEYFIRYDWPGNVRELRNIVENTIVSSEGDVIGLEDMPQRMISARPAPQMAMRPSGGIPAGASMREAVEEMQREVITQALKKHGSLRKAAKALDMDATTLYRTARKLGIQTNGEETAGEQP